MSTLSVRLFGKFCAQCDGQVLAGLEAFKVQELFCYLLLHRDRPYARESLAGLLWGESSAAQSKKYLRQALWKLRSALDVVSEHGEDCILAVDPNWVRLNSTPSLWLDVAAFEQADASHQGVPGQKLDTDRAHALQVSVQLYQSDLLEGWYQDWSLCERERLQNLYLAMLDKLMAYCEAHSSYEAGLDYGARLLHCDRAHERTHRRLMRLHHLAGDRTAALRQYEQCVTSLHQELGVKPAKRTVLLYEQIRADLFDPSAPELPEPIEMSGAPDTNADALPEVLSHLQQMRAILADFQSQIQRDIRTVETVLKSQR